MFGVIYAHPCPSCGRYHTECLADPIGLWRFREYEYT